MRDPVGGTLDTTPDSACFIPFLPSEYFYPYGRGDHKLKQLAATGQPGEYLTRRISREATDFIGCEA